MVPTEDYFTFQLAKQLGVKVIDMLLGGSQPMSSMEHYLWMRFEMAGQRLEQQARPRQRKR